MAELIQKTDTLNEGREKLNEAIEAFGEATLNIDVLEEFTFNNYVDLPINFEYGSASSTSGGLIDATNRLRFGKIYINHHILNLKETGIKYIVIYYNEDGTFNSSTGSFIRDPIYKLDNSKFACIVVVAKDGDPEIPSIHEFDGKIKLYQPSAYNAKATIGEKISLHNNAVGRINVYNYYWSDACVVGDEFWAFRESDADQAYDPVNKIGCIYIFDSEFNLKKRLLHNFGHVNSVEYSEGADALIFGNGSGNAQLPSEFYVLKNVKHWSGFKEDTMLDMDSSIQGTQITKYPSVAYLGWKLNVVWGDDNYGKNNIAYAISNNAQRIRKLLLGQGGNQFEEGTYVSGKADDEYNGTFKTLQTWNLPETDVVQGACYGDNGSLYIGLGHDGIWVLKVTLKADGSYELEEKHELQYRPDGTTYPYNATESVTIFNGFIFNVTFGSSGAKWIHKYRVF